MCLSLAFRENREVLKEKVKNKIYDLDYSHCIGLDSCPLCYNACEAYS